MVAIVLTPVGYPTQSQRWEEQGAFITAQGHTDLDGQLGAEEIGIAAAEVWGGDRGTDWRASGGMTWQF